MFSYIQCIFWPRTAKNLLYFLSYLWCWWLDYLAWSCTLTLRSPAISESEARSDQRSNRKMFGKHLMTASHVHTVQLCLKQKGFSTGYWLAERSRGRTEEAELGWVASSHNPAAGTESWRPGHMQKLPADLGDLPCSDWPQIYRIWLPCMPTGWGLYALPLPHIIPF